MDERSAINNAMGRCSTEIGSKKEAVDGLFKIIANATRAKYVCAIDAHIYKLTGLNLLYEYWIMCRVNFVGVCCESSTRFS